MQIRYSFQSYATYYSLSLSSPYFYLFAIVCFTEKLTRQRFLPFLTMNHIAQCSSYVMFDDMDICRTILNKALHWGSRNIMRPANFKLALRASFCIRISSFCHTKLVRISNENAKKGCRYEWNGSAMEVELFISSFKSKYFMCRKWK